MFNLNSMQNPREKENFRCDKKKCTGCVYFQSRFFILMMNRKLDFSVEMHFQVLNSRRQIREINFALCDSLDNDFDGNSIAFRFSVEINKETWTLF